MFGWCVTLVGIYCDSVLVCVRMFVYVRVSCVLTYFRCVVCYGVGDVEYGGSWFG